MVQTCKLYRNLYEIFHPSISRKNITEYQIVLNENVLPIQVFYPDKNVELNKVIVYVPGVKRDVFFYEELAKQMNSMVFLLDFLEDDVNNQYESTIRYIWDELKYYSIYEGLSFMADGVGCNIRNSLDDFTKQKKIFLNPISSFENRLENSIVITNVEHKKEGVYSFIGDFSRIDKEDGLAIRESVFSTVREFLSDIIR